MTTSSKTNKDKLMVSHGNITHTYGDKCKFCEKVKLETEPVIEILNMALKEQRNKIKKNLLELADKYESEDMRIVIEDYFRK